MYRSGARHVVTVTATGIGLNSAGDAYGIWLTGPRGKDLFLGFVDPKVGRDRRLSTEGVVPAGAAGYQQLLVTLERTASPKRPGKVVLEGTWRM